MFYQPRFQDTGHQLLYLATLFKGTSDYSGVLEYHIYFLTFKQDQCVNNTIGTITEGVEASQDTFPSFTGTNRNC